MRIGFDLDKIFINYPPMVPDKIIDRLYKKKSNGVLLYRIPTKPEQVLRRLSHLSILRPPITENISFLKSLPKSKHQLFLISSRYKFLERVTENLMKKHSFDEIFEERHFNFENKQPHIFKSDVLKKLKIDKYVDDDLQLLKYVAKENPKTMFYWLSPVSSSEKLPKNIKTIRNLSEILT